MSTTNYGLYLTDDSSTRFQEWRAKINGTEDSNMIKIDTALGNKADKSTACAAVLAANSWIGSAAPYTQTVSITGLAASHNGVASIPESATDAQIKAVVGADFYIQSQVDGALTIAARNEKPTIDIPILIILIN